MGEAVFVAAVSAELTVSSVLTAIMATCLATGGLFVAALYTSTSVNRGVLIRNMMLGLLGACVLNLVLLLFMILTWSFRDSTLMMVSSMLMVVIVGIYIVAVLLLILIPDAMDKDDYILGALRLYVELVRLFFYMLVILGKKK